MSTEKIQLHDFILGRRNCQQYLRDIFVMDMEDMTKNDMFPEFAGYAGMEEIPITPLVGTAADCADCFRAYGIDHAVVEPVGRG